MAKITGGVFSRPSGTTGGLVFGAARTVAGKVGTIRERVDPSNPNSAAQQIQRGKFLDSQAVVRDIGPNVYRTDWDRAIGELPGFNSLMSILLDNISDSYTFSAPPDTNLGTLHFPDSFSVATGGTGPTFDLTWSTENGANGDAADELQLIAIEAARDGNGEHDVSVSVDAETRDTGSYTFTVGVASTSYVVAGYFKGTLGEPADISIAVWHTETSGAT